MPCVDGDGARIVATFRSGSLGCAAIASWLRHRPPSAKLEPETALRRRIEERVVLEILDRRFVDLGLESDPDARAWRRLLERRLAAQALRHAVAAQTSPSESDVEAAYLADPHRFDHPQRWQLQNLFKRFPVPPTESDRARLRLRMAALREEIGAGADFADVARRESDSTTRVRGGAMGGAALAELDSQVAQAVGALAPGELSPVLETDEGLTLLRCTGIVPERRLTPEEARGEFRELLRSEAVERAWTELIDRLLEELAPSYSLRSADGPEATVATVRNGIVTETITRRDLDFFLRDINSPPATALTPEALHSRARDLVIQVGSARESARRGITESREFQERLALEALEMRAELALEPAIRARLTPPSATEVASLYERQKERFTEPASTQLRTLEIPIRRDLPASLYERFRDAGVRIRNGELTLEQARDALAPHAHLVDRGWLSGLQLFGLGRGVEQAAERLEPGQSSEPVQEGRRLLLVHVVARIPARPLSLDESRERLAAALARTQRERIRTELRAEIARDQEIRFAP